MSWRDAVANAQNAQENKYIVFYCAGLNQWSVVPQDYYDSENKALYSIDCEHCYDAEHVEALVYDTLEEASNTVKVLAESTKLIFHLHSFELGMAHHDTIVGGK